MEDCLACDLTSGKLDLPGGIIFSTRYWNVSHCIGPLNVGTLIVAPSRHCLHVWELTEEETKELGPLLQRVAAVIKALLEPDQVYVCLWSHMGWKPGHIHFILQPSWNHLQNQYSRPGPTLQAEMIKAKVPPPRDKVEAFAAKAKEFFQAFD